jgi:hypothetical protein
VSGSKVGSENEQEAANQYAQSSSERSSSFTKKTDRGASPEPTGQRTD